MVEDVKQDFITSLHNGDASRAGIPVTTSADARERENNKKNIECAISGVCGYSLLQPRMFSRAIAIESALAQTYPRVRDYRCGRWLHGHIRQKLQRLYTQGVHYVRQNNQGLAAARNTGLAREPWGYPRLSGCR